MKEGGRCKRAEVEESDFSKMEFTDVYHGSIRGKIVLTFTKTQRASQF